MNKFVTTGRAFFLSARRIATCNDSQEKRMESSLRTAELLPTEAGLHALFRLPLPELWGALNDKWKA
jgi:hypothetical protein